MAAGHAVTGWNRSRDKAEPLIKAGMHFAATPRAAAAAADIVFSIVTDAAAVRSIALGEDALLPASSPAAFTSTVSTIAPDASRTISAEFARQGLTMLDGPISAARSRWRKAMRRSWSRATRRPSSGSSRCCARSDRVTYIGASGLAVQMKISVNLLLMVG
jgi:3-hydroxyisobutyrate dehydrogenase-like beta-hydroxyacid dehydrogenase